MSTLLRQPFVCWAGYYLRTKLSTQLPDTSSRRDYLHLDKAMNLADRLSSPSPESLMQC